MITESLTLKNKNGFWTRYRTEIICTAVFLIIPLLIFFDALYSNYMIGNGDLFGELARNSWTKEAISAGTFPFWDIFESGGVPNVAFNIYYPVFWLLFPFDPVTQTTLFFALHLSMGGIFMFFYLKEIRISNYAAFFGGIVFMLSNMFVLRVAHATVMATMIWTPLLLLMAEKLIKSNGQIKFALLTGIVVALQALAGFPQVFVYSCIFVLIYYIANAIHKKMNVARMLLAFIIAVVVAFCLWAVVLLPTLQAIRVSDRASNDSYDFFSYASFSPQTLLGMIFPQGWFVMDVPAKGEFQVDIYMGIAVLALFIYGVIFCWKRFHTKLFTILLILVFLFMICPTIEPIGRIVQKIPIIGSFRCAARAVFLFGICEIAVAVIALENIIKNKEYNRYLKFSLVFFVAVCFVMLLIYLHRHLLFSEINEFFKVRFFMPMLISAINLIIAAVMAFCFSKNKKNLSIIIVVLLTVLNVLDVGFMNIEEGIPGFVATGLRYDASVYGDTELADFMNQNAGLEYRVAKIGDTVTASSVSMYNRAEIVGHYLDLNGYIPYENKDYLSLFGIESISLFAGNDPNPVNLSIYSMLATKYFAVQGGYNFQPYDILTDGTRPSGVILENRTEFMLKGNSDSENFQIWESKIDLEPNSIYLVSAEVDGIGPNDTTYLDFFGTDFDLGKHNMILTDKHAIEGYSFIVNTIDDTVPEDAVIRLVSNNQDDITVKSIRVYKLESEELDLPVAGVLKDYQMVSVQEGSKIENDDIVIYENPNAKKILYSADQVVRVEDKNEVLFLPDLLDFDRNIYVLDHNDMDLTNSNTQIDIGHIDGNNISANVSSDQDTFIVMAQNYYQDWRAYVDGKETKIYLSNGVIQGIDVPAGEHLIEFKYIPLSYYIGLAISCTTVVVIVIFFIVQGWKKRHNKSKTHGIQKIK